MADAGGHFANLAEAEKLSLQDRIPGVVEEDMRVGGLAALLPTSQFVGTKTEWNREKTIPTALRAGRGTQMLWQDASEYDLLERQLKTSYIQTPLDKYVESIYGTRTNYAVQQLQEDRKALMQLIESDLIYGSGQLAGSPDEPHGIHALAGLYGEAGAGDMSTNALNIDEGEGALSLANMRSIMDDMRAGIDFWLFPKVIATRMDQMLQEGGISSFAGMGQITMGADETGRHLTSFGGIPIIRSDYLVAENANTGTDGTTARTKLTAGATANYSIFAVKAGSLANANNPGLSFAFGNSGEQGRFIKTDVFDKLENFNAGGLRQVAYYNLADGSSLALGRIYDITNAAVTA